MGRLSSSILLVAAFVLGQTGQNVTLPMLSDAIGAAGGTPYFVVWFSSLAFTICFGVAFLVTRRFNGSHDADETSIFKAIFQTGPMLVGLCDAMNGMMLVFASPSSRTAPYLQAILTNVAIPLTIAVRVSMIGEFPKPLQLWAALSVLVGILISLKPTIFEPSGSSTTESSIFWPLWFMAGMLPQAFMTVFEEKLLKGKHRNTNVVQFVFSLNLWQFIFVSALFWVDVVPGYGMSSGLEAWAQHMRNGLKCTAFGDSCGSTAFSWGLLFVSCYMVTYVAGAMLLRHTEGAVWQVILSSLVGPLSTVWWALFQPKPYFHWEPAWGEKMTFAMLGLFFIVPSVVGYNYNATKGSSVESVSAVASQDLLDLEKSSS